MGNKDQFRVKDVNDCRRSCDLYLKTFPCKKSRPLAFAVTQFFAFGMFPEEKYRKSSAEGARRAPNKWRETEENGSDVSLTYNSSPFPLPNLWHRLYCFVARLCVLSLFFSLSLYQQFPFRPFPSGISGTILEITLTFLWPWHAALRNSASPKTRKTKARRVNRLWPTSDSTREPNLWITSWDAISPEITTTKKTPRKLTDRVPTDDNANCNKIFIIVGSVYHQIQDAVNQSRTNQLHQPTES